MLLQGYHKEIFRSRCNREAQSLHCFAHLHQDIAAVIPYLNAELEGDSFTADPPSVTFKAHGKLITVHPQKIAINALQSEEQAQKICDWLMREINDIWQRRDQIKPKYQARSVPKVFEALKRLPNRAGCPRECGQPTCMVFATLLCDGAASPQDCPHLEEDKKQELEEYLAGFGLE
ncbi:MAG: (Fe-S)-binding protein [Desulfohalobiaceae bacterium]